MSSKAEVMIMPAAVIVGPTVESGIVAITIYNGPGCFSFKCTMEDSPHLNCSSLIGRVLNGEIELKLRI